MKYLKNMINNIIYLLKHDLVSDLRKIDILVNANINTIDELVKVTNENYQTLYNKCIDNKNRIDNV